MDLVATAWTNRREPKKQPSELKTLKTVRPTYLLPTEGNTSVIFYLWRLPEPDPDFENHEAILVAGVRSVTHLGWGVDMVAADAFVISDAEAQNLPGECWSPTDNGAGKGLRARSKVRSMRSSTSTRRS